MAKRLFLPTVSVFLLAGCAHNLEIPEEKLSGKTASMTFSSQDLKGTITVPLFFHKNVEISLTEYKGCKDGKWNYNKEHELGDVRLTPGNTEYEAKIPSSSEILLHARSETNAGGNRHSCHTYLRFTPEENKQYKYEFTPQPSFGKVTCSGDLKERDEDGKFVDVDSALYPPIESHKALIWGYHNEFKLCGVPYKKVDGKLQRISEVQNSAVQP